MDRKARRWGSATPRWPNCVAWDRLGIICGEVLSKGTQILIEGRLQTRQWDDDRGSRHFKTEVVAESVEVLSSPAKRREFDKALATDAPVGEQ